jgi:hypothetical protein
VLEPKSPFEVLIDKLEEVSSPEQFADVVGGYPSEVIEDAIVFQDTQPKRLQLTKWLHESQRLEEKIATYAELLRDGLRHGVETVKELLKCWSQAERWGAISELERVAPDALARLASEAPNWVEWCG